MNKREDALLEALRSNAEETERWKTFLKENETAKENLSMFQKRLSVDVMVPVGKKALMPGHLIHTNEILVGHYQGYFSKCSAHKAAEICDFRIKTAKEHLKKLETELDLWQNKLEKPYAEGVIPSGDEREIIEEFNEEQEKLWRQQHKIRLKEAKQQERKEREKELTKGKINKQDSANDKSDEEIFKMLEDAEIMEELEDELEQLQVDEVNDETIRKLMSGQMHLPPEKKRVAHNATAKIGDEEEKTLTTNIVKKISIQETVPATNNNVVPNPDITENDNGEEEDDEEPLQEEVRIIKEQAKFLEKEDQIGFYEYQIEIIQQKIAVLPLRNQDEMDEKIRLLTVLEQLEELLDLAETAVGNDELAEQDENDTNVDSETESARVNANNEQLSANSNAKKGNQKRRISFASEDQTLEFCKNEAVTQMLPEKKDPPKRDVIKLDDDVQIKASNENEATLNSTNKKDLIKSKVEQNLQFISENQSKQDFDLVNKILETSMGRINTLHIKFKHSQQNPMDSENKTSEIPISPADFYNLYLKSKEMSREEEPSTLFINSYDGEDQVSVPVLRETDRHQAFVDPKAEFSNPKSILRNKAAIDKENHYIESQERSNDKKTKKSKKKRTPKEEEESLSAYNKVMNEVIEKPLTEPEPLPEGNFIDAHAPKRRVSRFKQMRQGTGKT